MIEEPLYSKFYFDPFSFKVAESFAYGFHKAYTEMWVKNGICLPEDIIIRRVSSFVEGRFKSEIHVKRRSVQTRSMYDD